MSDKRIMGRTHSKRGSSAVFLTVILATMMSIVIALVYGVKAETAISNADAIISLAGDSILSEFDLKLQQEYGLFLLKGTDDELSEKLLAYVKYSFDDIKDIKLKSVEVTASKYSIANIDLVKKQIIEYMKVREAAGLVKSFMNSYEQSQNPGSNHMQERSLKHGPTIASLPSAGMPKRNLTVAAEELAKKANEVETAFKAGTDTFFINRYIFDVFNSNTQSVNENHFFRNEVEYILAGEMTDKKNIKRIEMALKAMRFPINMAHLYADAEKQAVLTAAAQTLTPGAAAVVTQAALASTWAYAESDNDIELLMSGYKIPMIKDKSTWAIDLNTAIEGILGGTVVPVEEKGYRYNEYLNILLFFQDENIKLARMMDLIQINMRAGYDREFLISEYATGVSVRVNVNDKILSYEKKY